MENEQSGDIGSFLAGFIIGGLVGAAAALILAPQSGAETRERLAEQSAHLREVGTERLHNAQEYVSDARDRAQETATHMQEQARIVLDEGKSRLGRHDDEDVGSILPENDTAAKSEASPSGDPGETA